MLAVVAASVEQLASYVLNKEFETLFNFSKSHVLDNEIAELFSEATLNNQLEAAGDELTGCISKLHEYFRGIQSYVRDVDICAVKNVTKDPRLRYFVNSHEEYDPNDYLAFRLELNDHILSAEEMLEKNCPQMTFEFSGFADIEAGIQEGTSGNFISSTRQYIGGRDQYLCVLVDFSVPEEVAFDIIRMIVSNIHEKTEIRVLYVGQDFQVVNDYIETRHFNVSNLSYRQRSVPIIDEHLFRLLYLEQQRFQDYRNTWGAGPRRFSRSPKMCAIIISGGLVETRFQEFGKLKIPVSVVIPDSGEAHDVPKFEVNLRHFSAMHDLEVVSYRKTASAALDERLQRREDASRLYQFYCPDTGEAIAPQYFQFSDSVAETMGQATVLVQRACIFEALRPLFPVGDEMQFIEQSGVLIAAFPLFKILGKRGETLLGIFSIGTHLTGEDALIFNGDPVYASTELQSVLLAAPEMMQRLANSTQKQQKFDVQTPYHDPLRITIKTIRENLSTLGWRQYSSLYQFLHSEEFAELLTCELEREFAVICQSDDIYARFSVIQDSEQYSFAISSSQSRRFRLLYDYWKSNPQGMSIIRVICSPDKTVCLSDDRNAIIAVAIDSSLDESQAQSAYLRFENTDCLLFCNKIEVFIESTADYPIPALHIYFIIPLHEWMLGQQAEAHGYKIALVLDEMRVLFPNKPATSSHSREENSDISESFLEKLLIDNKLIDSQTMRVENDFPGGIGLRRLTLPNCKTGDVLVQSLFENHLVCYYANLRGICESDMPEFGAISINNSQQISPPKELFYSYHFHYEIEANYYDTIYSRYDGSTDNITAQIKQSSGQPPVLHRPWAMNYFYIGITLIIVMGTIILAIS